MLFRRLGLIMLGLAVCAVAQPIGSPAAFAHSKATASAPEQGSVIKPGLEKIVLGFAKPVRLTVATLKADNGLADARLKPEASGGFAKSFAFPAKLTEAGAYAVEWVAIATDGHVMRGTLRFEVRP